MTIKQVTMAKFEKRKHFHMDIWENKTAPTFKSGFLLSSVSSGVKTVLIL